MSFSPSISEETSADIQRVEQLLNSAGPMIGSGRQPEILRAAQQAEEAVAICLRLDAAGVPGIRRLLSGALFCHADALRESGDPGVKPLAQESYGEALKFFGEVMNPDDIGDAHHLAKIWMSRGMTFLEDGDAEALPQALECFERALDLRESLPQKMEAPYAWALSAAWMNRGDVLSRLGSPEQLTEAVRSYDEAITLLDGMPAEEYPNCRVRLGLAWMNRGLASVAQRNEAGHGEGLRSFTMSVKELGQEWENISPEQRRILSCAQLNRGNALLSGPQPDAVAAREEALAAIASVAEFEQQEPVAALMSLQSRHLFCRGSAYMVDHGQATGDWMTEVTDTVDEGMALGRHWRLQGQEHLGRMELELLRFGALTYRLFQPHFLPEFLLESMDPERSPGAPVMDGKMHHVAAEALGLVVNDLRAAQQGDRTPEQMEAILELLQELQEAEQRLGELRAKYLETPPQE